MTALGRFLVPYALSLELKFWEIHPKRGSKVESREFPSPRSEAVWKVFLEFSVVVSDVSKEVRVFIQMLRV